MTLHLVKDVLDKIEASASIEEIKGMVYVLKIQIDDHLNQVNPITFHFEAREIISCIKEVRHLMGLGLREAKDLIESRQMTFKHEDQSVALQVYKAIKPYCNRLEIVNAPRAMKVLF